MAVTAQQVYEMALDLMDEVSDNGSPNPDNPNYYINRSMPIITLLETELISSKTVPQIVQNMTDILIVPDQVALKVLPYGLAAHLIMVDDPNAAMFFNARYDELKRKTPIVPDENGNIIQPIVDVYDVSCDVGY